MTEWKCHVVSRRVVLRVRSMKTREIYASMCHYMCAAACSKSMKAWSPKRSYSDQSCIDHITVTLQTSRTLIQNQCLFFKIKIKLQLQRFPSEGVWTLNMLAIVMVHFAKYFIYSLTTKQPSPGFLKSYRLVKVRPFPPHRLGPTNCFSWTSRWHQVLNEDERAHRSLAVVL